MYKRLLLPLDGSSMAESILPVAVCLTRSLGAAVALIHVIEKNAPQKVHGEEHLQEVDEAETYLQKIAAERFADVSQVETHVHREEVGDIAQGILQHVGEFHSDLTLMTTHGHSGARHFLYGSIAQQIAAAAVPVLFVRADAMKERGEFSLRQLLVPMDGDPEHEQGLAAAAELARVCKSSVHLLSVVPNLSLVSGSWTQSVRLQPSTTERMLRMEVGELEDYLATQCERLEQMDLSVSTEVLRGDPAELTVALSASGEIDLVVLGTHGTVGTEAFWSGSVAAKIARKTAAPVLLVPARSSS